MSFFSMLTAQPDAYDDKSKKILQDYLSQSNTASRNGSIPDIASVDLKYIRLLQMNRLQNKNADIRTEYLMEDDPFSGVAWKLDTDTRYITRIPYCEVKSKTDYLINGKRTKREKEKQNLYGYIIWLKDQNINASYCCPNCGAVSTVAELFKGCPFCGTKFFMNELFPKLTNLYTLKQRTFLSVIPPFLIFGILLMLGVYGYGNYETILADFGSPDIFPKITQLFGMVLAGIGGIIAGYLLFGLFTVTQITVNSIMSIPKLSKLNKTKKQLPLFMRSFEPNFSLDHFIGKLMTLIGTMVYSDDYSNCAVYCGEPTVNRYRDIIDLRYEGYLDVRKCKIQGNYAYIETDVYMNNVYCKGNCIFKKNNRFRMLLCKNINAENDYGFSIHKIECKSCGASFDATREKCCPFCKAAYRLADYDWVVLNFDKK